MDGGASNPLGGGGAGGHGGMNREQMKKMSEADKEMELRANRAKALLAERHIGLKTNQVSLLIVRISLCFIQRAATNCHLFFGWELESSALLNMLPS